MSPASHNFEIFERNESCDKSDMRGTVSVIYMEIMRAKEGVESVICGAHDSTRVSDREY